MARALRRNGEDWLAEPTGLAHQVDLQWSTQIRFQRADGTGDEVFGRVMVNPPDVGSVTEEQLLQALDEALNPADDDA